MRRIMLSQRNAVLVFLLVFGLYEGQVLAQAVRENYTTTADVSLRSGPGMKYPVVTTLPKGTNINVVGREGYWLKVESKHGGQPGFMSTNNSLNLRPPKPLQRLRPRRSPAPIKQ